MKLSNLFHNRWMALVWAAGVLWLAIDFAGPGESAGGNNQVTTDVTGEQVSNQQVEQVASIVANL